MQLTIRCPDAITYVIKDLPDEDCLALAEEFDTGDDQVLTFQMDQAVVKIARRNIIAVELD